MGQEEDVHALAYQALLFQNLQARGEPCVKLQSPQTEEEGNENLRQESQRRKLTVWVGT